MQTTDYQAALEKIFPTAQSFLIILRSNPSFDQAATALSLATLLQDAKKSCHLACEQNLPDSLKVLSGSTLVTQSVGNQSLDVIFDYDENAVENVSYNIDQANKKFHLVIKPKRGHRGLDPTTIEYAQIGIDADVIFLIGVSSFDQMKAFYSQDELAFTRAHTIAVNRQVTSFAQTNIDTSGYTSNSEWLITLIGLWKLTITSDVATNILAGIESATDSFRHASVTADTFQIIAELMRSGAKRLQLTPAQASSNSILAQAFAQKPKPAVTSTPVNPLVSPPAQGSLGYAPPAR